MVLINFLKKMLENNPKDWHIILSKTLCVTPQPSPRRTIGAPHGTRTPLTDFLTLVGPFQYINPNIII